MQTAKSILIIGFIVAFFLVCVVSYAVDVPEGIIFVDLSRSVKKHNAWLKSRALLIAFLRTFKKPFRIVLAGFDEEIHEYISVVTETEADIETLAGEIQKIDARSYCTDLEIPFRYLLERDDKEAIGFVLIISDGEPDIWDGKLRHFSKNVKSDPMYEDLNRQYRMLKASGLSPDELFDRLRHLYHRRNLELIEEQLSALRDALGDRIILWDLSGESGYLKNWAEEYGGRYLPMKAEEDATSVDRLRKVILSVPGRSSSVVASRLPSPDLGGKPKKPAGQTPKQISGDGVDGWTISAAVALFVLIGLGGMVMLSRFRSASIKEVPNYMDDKIRRAMGDAEKLCDELIEEETKALEFDRRFSIRVPVPPGAMEVHWTNDDSSQMWGQAVNISMNAVLFEAPGFRAESIDRVVCPRLDVVFNVVRSSIHRKVGDSVVAVLEEFEDNVDDSMRWVEILTSIDGLVKSSN
ncbi:MAG: VWA domain-containing protein [Desulfobacterales bacterium]|nr:VWA domain-containing protein [Desulfobacterales bacterium]